MKSSNINLWRSHQTKKSRESISNRSHLPKISIITPSYNQGQFIEKTIKSILSQNYPNLEYIIIDGGSKDNTLEIIKKYDSYLTYWVSESDIGQSHAINKGLEKITGDIWAYVNSDDLLLPNSLIEVAQTFQNNPDLLWVTGSANYIDEKGKLVAKLTPTPVKSKREALIRWEGNIRGICIEPANFMRREVIERYGYYDTCLNCCMDFEYNLRLFFDDIVPTILDRVLAEACLHSESKTVALANSNDFIQEDFAIVEKYLPFLNEEEAKIVRHKIAEKKFWLNLQDIQQTLQVKGEIKALKQISNNFFKNPKIIFKRSVLGTIKKIII